MASPRQDDETDETLSGYERAAGTYDAATSRERTSLVALVVDRCGPGARVLELGSGPGRDADALESEGLVVERTDGASSFVEMQRAQGRRARQLDVRAPDFGGGYDAVFANAVLLHLPREGLPSVLETARRAVVPGGVLAATFQRGSGSEWSLRKIGEPRFFTYWQPGELAEAARCAGWSDVAVVDSTAAGSPSRWLTLSATAPER